MLEYGDYVICIDNLSTGSIKNIQDIADNDNFKFIYCDIEEKLEYNVDQIYNLACPASPQQYQLDPIKTMKTNVLGTCNVLELAQKNSACILQASTSEIYGDPVEHPQHEGYWGNVNPVGPRACYDEGKRVAEALFYDYYRKFCVPIKILRIFNTYGPGMRIDDGRVISNFILKAMTNENIPVFGDGNQTRSFCYITDLIEGMIKFMNSRNDLTGPINMGNTYEITILELAELIIKLCGSNSKVIYKNLPEDDPKQRKPNIDMAEKELNWKPRVNLEEGIIKMVQYYSSLLSLRK